MGRAMRGGGSPWRTQAAGQGPEREGGGARVGKLAVQQDEEGKQATRGWDFAGAPAQGLATSPARHAHIKFSKSPWNISINNSPGTEAEAEAQRS